MVFVMISKVVRVDGNIIVSIERVILAVGVGYVELMGEVGVAIFVFYNFVDFGEFFGRVVVYIFFVEFVLIVDV